MRLGPPAIGQVADLRTFLDLVPDPRARRGHALDRTVGACLAGRNSAGTASEQQQAIAVDGKPLRGSARLSADRRHLLPAVTHHQALTLAQAEAGTKTNETAHFRPLLEPLHLDAALVTFNACTQSTRTSPGWPRPRTPTTSP